MEEVVVIAFFARSPVFSTYASCAYAAVASVEWAADGRGKSVPVARSAGHWPETVTPGRAGEKFFLTQKDLLFLYLALLWRPTLIPYRTQLGRQATLKGDS